MELNRIKMLIDQSLTKIVKDGKIDSQLREVLEIKELQEGRETIIKDIVKRFREENKVPSLQYLNERYSFIENDSEMNQKDLFELLRLEYVNKFAIIQHAENINNIANGDVETFLKIMDKIKSNLIKLDTVQMDSFGDIQENKNNLDKISDKSNIMTFGKMKPFNLLQIRAGQLVEILAGSGEGKSFTIQKLNAESKKDICLHFSLELPKELFMMRMIMCLGWATEEQIENMSEAEKTALSNRLANNFPNWHYMCLDSKGADKINTHKIESMVKYYRTIYPDKTIKIFIDYIQIMNENFDPVSCRVSEALNEIAVRYHVCIIAGVQGSDEASKSEEPAELSHMAFVKSLKNGASIIVSQKAIKFDDSENKVMFKYKTKKHRWNKIQNFTYLIDTNKKDDNWTLTDSNKKATPNYDYKEGDYKKVENN